MNQKSKDQNVKDVINASSRAISKDKNLHVEVSYNQAIAGPEHNVQENLKSIQLSRGDADKKALLQKYKLIESCLLYTSPSPRD